ncbi:hypothetical protein E2C01_004282 [Portunus trituberculatus]|uniref:Uncharacterized protein n=1 Tax=Portunus trituberculatus TaxID=210409 RepID=A0A5B7CPJ1_PORTR|nr:hypothetical protein [Portunus trituberculatus]
MKSQGPSIHEKPVKERKHDYIRRAADEKCLQFSKSRITSILRKRLRVVFIPAEVDSQSTSRSPKPS